MNPAGEQRHDELVEAHALPLGLFDELDVQGDWHTNEDSAAGFHEPNDITGAIDLADSAGNITRMSKRGQDIEVGDIIMFFGQPHRVARIEPYEHPTVPGACGVAYAADGWGISLWTNYSLEVG